MSEPVSDEVGEAVVDPAGAAAPTEVPALADAGGPAEAEPSRPRGRRRLRLAAALTAALLVVGGGTAWVVTAVHRHWFDAVRDTTLHQLSAVGAPAGFRTVAAGRNDPGPAGYDPTTGIARRYFAGTLVPRSMSRSLNTWLGDSGLLTPYGPAESRQCGRVDVGGEPTFGCGNFYRVTPSWLVWITVTGPHWPGHGVPALNRPTPVRIELDVQRRRPLSRQWSPVPGLTSPGLARRDLPAGQDRTVLALSPAQARTLSLDGATFGPQGQLVLSGSGLPVVVPAAAGAVAQRLIGTAWPSVVGEVTPVRSESTADAARVAADGSLWLHTTGGALRRIEPDGHVTDVTGTFAVPDPFTGAMPFAVSPDGTAWVAGGQLIRLRDAKQHVMDPALTGVQAVVGDGGNGVWFAGPTTVYHLSTDGQRTALPATFDDVSSIALAPNGALWVVDGAWLKRVSRDGRVTVVAGDGSTFAGRDDPVFCRHSPPTQLRRLPVSAAYDVIAAPDGGIYLTGCGRLVQVG